MNTASIYIYIYTYIYILLNYGLKVYVLNKYHNIYKFTCHIQSSYSQLLRHVESHLCRLPICL